jgi:hypothetical protein
MKQITILCHMLLFAVFLNGCASTLSMTYYSVPPGAAIYNGDNYLGDAPVILTYVVDSAAIQSGYLIVQSPKVVWPSGAKIFINEGIRVDLHNTLAQQYTFYRPSHFPGLEDDIVIGREHEMMRAQKSEKAQRDERAKAEESSKRLNDSLNHLLLLINPAIKYLNQAAYLTATCAK